MNTIGSIFHAEGKVNKVEYIDGNAFVVEYRCVNEGVVACITSYEFKTQKKLGSWFIQVDSGSEVGITDVNEATAMSDAVGGTIVRKISLHPKGDTNVYMSKFVPLPEGVDNVRYHASVSGCIIYYSSKGAEETEELPTRFSGINRANWINGSNKGGVFSIKRNKKDLHYTVINAETQKESTGSVSYEGTSGIFTIIPLSETDNFVRLTFQDGQDQQMMTLKTNEYSRTLKYTRVCPMGPKHYVCSEKGTMKTHRSDHSVYNSMCLGGVGNMFACGTCRFISFEENGKITVIECADIHNDPGKFCPIPDTAPFGKGNRRMPVRYLEDDGMNMEELNEFDEATLLRWM